jgi:hypothetical protein
MIVVAVDDKAKQGFEQLKRTSARFVLVAYYQALLVDQTAALLKCSKETFEVQKGHCLQLQALIKSLET